MVNKPGLWQCARYVQFGFTWTNMAPKGDNGARGGGTCLLYLIREQNDDQSGANNSRDLDLY